MKNYEMGLYEKAMPNTLSWEEKMQAAKKAGYDFIEISIDETDAKLARLDMSQEERAKIVSLSQKYDLPIRSMCLSGHRKYPLGSADPAVRERGMEIMEKALRLSQDLGVRMIQLAGYDVYYEDSTDETKQLFEENLKKAVLMAAKAGVLLGFETMETEFMNTVGKAMKYVDICNSPYLGVYPDVGNITNAAVSYGTDVLADMDTGAGHLIAVHLKETVPGVFREVPFGTGHVDFEAVIKKSLDLGVRRFTTEFWYVGQEEWMDTLYDAHDRMAEILAKLA